MPKLPEWLQSRRREMRERLDVGEAEADEIGQLQRARACNVAEGVAAYIAVNRSVGQFASADAIQHNPDDALKFGLLAGHEFPTRNLSASC